jgi:hypothetical protein
MSILTMGSSAKHWRNKTLLRKIQYKPCLFERQRYMKILDLQERAYEKSFFYGGTARKKSRYTTAFMCLGVLIIFFRQRAFE